MPTQVSDALTKLKYPHSGYIPDLDVYSPGADKQEATKIVGEAFTVKVCCLVSTSRSGLTLLPVRRGYQHGSSQGKPAIREWKGSCESQA